MLVSLLKKFKKELSDTIKRLEKLNYPEGSLLVKQERDFERLYIQRSQGKRLTYISKAKVKEVSQYAQKRYNKRLLKIARAEKLQIDKCLKALEPEADVDKVISWMPKILRPYVEANKNTDLGFAQMWQAEYVDQARRLEDREGLTTKRGDIVRSKSEVIIADRLYEAGIQYRYEVSFKMKYEDILYCYPDFQILNERTREVYYWEHLGMMGDPEYVTTQLKKISGYARKDVILGKNLLLTFESRERPLDTVCVDKLIKTFLV